MLVAIPPKCSVSDIVGCLKGKSSLMIFDRYAKMKHKFCNRHSCCRLYVDTVGLSEAVVKEYIRKQLHDDAMVEQTSLNEYVDPFHEQAHEAHSVADG
jgi:putative transposase